MCIRVAFTITLAARQRSAYKLKFDSLTQELKRKVVKAKGEPLTASEWARGKRAFSISSLSRRLAGKLDGSLARLLSSLRSQVQRKSPVALTARCAADAVAVFAAVVVVIVHFLYQFNRSAELKLSQAAHFLLLLLLILVLSFRGDQQQVFKL